MNRNRIVILAAAALSAALWTYACGDGATEPPPDPPRPTTVTVSPATARLAALGATVQLSAEVRDQNGNVMAGAAVSWSSGDATVATVDGSGLVTAAANGTATITATAGSVSGTAAVTVAQAASAVSVSPPADTLVAFGDSSRLAAEATDANGHAVAGAAVAWASSDTLVARVDGSGLVTAAANGTATITATAGPASGTATVTVAQEVGAVTVSPAADTLLAGDTLRLSAEAADANGHAVADAEFAWVSSDTLVAIVDESGLVTGAGAGEVTVTATSSGVTGSAELTVVAPAPTTVAVTPDTVAFTAFGQTARLAAEVRDQAGRVMTGVTITWSSGDTAVVVVDSAGLATAVGRGTTVIAARAGEASGEAVMTVMQSVGAVTVTPDADTVAIGDTLRLLAEAYDENGHRVDEATFTWSSNRPSVATVDGSGLVTGIAEGRTTITAAAGDASGTAVVTVENPSQPVGPVQVGTIPNQAVRTGQTGTLDVSSYFRDPDGDTLTYAAASSDTAVVSVSQTGSMLTLAGVATGTATVTVTATDLDGLAASQSFKVTVGGGGDDHSCGPGQETVLPWGGSTGGVLTAGDEDCFVVVVPAAATAGRLTAWTTGDTDTYGTLYDSSYGVIVENDDWISHNFLVSDDAASPGRYYLRVRAFDADESGPYVIHVDDHGDSIERSTLDWEAVIFDSIANAGSIATPGNRDFFGFLLGESALITGSMDTYGALYNEDGEGVGQDNDSGPGRNFRIELPLEEGIYFVEVRGFGNSTGSYELGVGAVARRNSVLPAWSPDGSRIAFVSDRDGSVDIYAMKADGTGVTRLTRDAAWDLFPAWSPDGSRIALSSDRDGNPEIYVMNADGTGMMRLTRGSPEGESGQPTWSPDGSGIAFASERDGNFDIYVMNADGTGVTRLTRDAGWDYFPAWSPDGSRIAFVSDRDDGFYEQIHVMNADGTGVTRLTSVSPWFDGSPAWSPDGSRIAFDSDRDGDFDIYVMNADGTGVTRLTRHSADDGLPSWSPDGSRIAFASNRDGNVEIYAMNSDGTGVTRLTTTSAQGDAASVLFSDRLRTGAGRFFRFAPGRDDDVRSRDGAHPAGRSPLLRSIEKQPVLKTKPQRRRGPRH